MLGRNPEMSQSERCLRFDIYCSFSRYVCSSRRSRHGNRFLVKMPSSLLSETSTPSRQLRVSASVRSVREQVENSNLSRDTPSSSVDDIPRILIGPKTYILESQIKTKSTNPRHSWVWRHGTALVEMPSQTPYWLCNRCDEARKFVLFNASTSSNPRKHLKTKHGITRPRADDESSSPEEETQPRINDMLARPSKRAKTGPISIPTALWDRFKAALIAWIIGYQIAFIAIENNFFRDLISVLSPTLATMLPTGNTIRSWIMDEYDVKKAKLKSKLREDSVGLVHISFDLWTSPNAKALMAVVAHYTNRQYRVETRLLALRRLHGDHSGENQAGLLSEVLKDFEITDKIGYFVTDNASNNDNAVDLLLRNLLPHLTAQQRQQRRLRCWGHILNLAAKAFLFGKDAANFDEEIIVARALAQERRELEAWRKRGPIGKLHNVVVFIKRSPQRQETFGEFAEDDDKYADLVLMQDNATRWNSSYKMIDRALKKRANIDKFIENSILEVGSKALPREDKLTNEDWRVLQETCRILKPFYDQTQRLQSRASAGHHGSIWEAYPSCDYLLKHILEERARCCQEAEAFENDEEAEKEHGEEGTIFTPQQSQKHIRTSIENCWAKLDYYYRILDDLPVYMAALVLHPGQKLAYIHNHWAGRRSWIDNAKRQVKILWETGWKGRHTTPNLEPQPSVEAPYIAVRNSTPQPDPFEQFLLPPGFYETSHTAQIDEYKKYLEIPHKPCEKPMDWWTSRGMEWPSLTAMAFDLFSVPLMSSECERVFSSAGWLITSRRNMLKEDVIEATTCLRGWQAIV